MRTVHVAAGAGYDVHIAPGLLGRTGALLRGFSAARTVALISDDQVYPLYSTAVINGLQAAGFAVKPFVFPHGERSKTLETYAALLAFLAENRLTRTDLILALGGGVVGDLAGFAAATYMRGMDFVQLPTTLLAAVDASVGGKTGVDLPAGKNLAGAFHQPRLVLCDPDTFDTLPPEVYRDGMAEVIKYGLLGDPELFRRLKGEPDREELLETCIAMKRDLVERDPYDTGDRRLLNLGHTVGHGIEKLSGYAVSHGSAVAMGMAAITRAAVKRNYCTAAVYTELLELLRRYGLPTELPYPADALAKALAGDKKMAGGKLYLIVPREIGRCTLLPIDLTELPGWLRDGGAL